MNFLIAPRIGNNRIERWIFCKAFCSGPSLASLQSLLHHDSPAFVCFTPSRVSRPLTLSWMLWSTYRACDRSNANVNQSVSSQCLHHSPKVQSCLIHCWQLQRCKCHLLKLLGTQPTTNPSVRRSHKPQKREGKRTGGTGKSQLFTRYREWLNSDPHAFGVLWVLEKQNN